MKLNAILAVLCACLTLSMTAQVGVNTDEPNRTLEVVGDVKVDNSLYLEDPGDSNQIRGSKLLIVQPDQSIVQYDISASKYGPINYAEFVFEDLSADGLQDYDTKIPTDEYIVSVQGYYYLEAGTGDTDIMTHSNTDSDNIEGHQIYAYRNSSTGTWFLRAFINDAEFQTRLSGSFGRTPVDMYLNLIIYRDGFISKSIDPITVSMGNAETGVAPLPEGF